jgi:hypothetical protein
MLGWIREKIAESQLKRETRQNIDLINAHGGSDKICLLFLGYISADKGRWAKLRNGLLDPSEYPMRRSLVGLAAIQSMMKARQELSNSLDPMAETVVRERLEFAQQAFLMSWLLISEADKAALDPDEVAKSRDAMIGQAFDTSDGIDFLKGFEMAAERKLADANLEQGRQALDNWRNTNPHNFPIVVKVHAS